VEDHEFQTKLGYTARPCLKKPKRKKERKPILKKLKYMKQRSGGSQFKASPGKWFMRPYFENTQHSWAPVAHAYNSSYSGGRDQQDHGSKPDWTNSSPDPVLKKIITKKKGLMKWLKQ
jgi:hypothetical protein